MPVGSGQRPLKGDPALPLLKLASFLPFNDPDGVKGWASAFGPRNSRRCPQPTPHCAHSPTARSGKRSTPGLGPPLGEPTRVAGNRGSGSPAPAAPPPLAPARAPFATQIAQGLAGAPNSAQRPARSLSRMGASYVAGGRQGLREAAGCQGAGAAPHPASSGAGRARGHRPLLL